MGDVKEVFQEMAIADNKMPYVAPAEMVNMLEGFYVPTSLEKLNSLYGLIGYENDMNVSQKS